MAKTDQAFNIALGNRHMDSKFQNGGQNLKKTYFADLWTIFPNED